MPNSNQSHSRSEPAVQHDDETLRSASMSRRAFLVVTLSGAVGIIVAACTRKTPTPAPTPVRTLSPTFTSTPLTKSTLAATGTPTGIPEPTATQAATSEPTATAPATPEPTPTPTATPFPPGPPSKLGVFIGYNHPQIFELLATGNVALVKTLEVDPNFVTEIKRLSPNTVLVARFDPLPLPDLDNWNPEDAARQFVEQVLPIATEPRRQAAIDAWESFNEPIPQTVDQMARLAVFEAERTRLLAAAGIRSCVGNFATGQPPLELWPAFYPALQAVKETNGFLGLHEYSAPYMWFGSGTHQLQEDGDEGDEGWLTLRYRKVYRDYLEPAGLAVPLLITETGIDGLVAGRPGPQGGGWKDFVTFWRDEGKVSTTAEGFYVEQLAWYDGEMQRDNYVKGASIYTLAGPAGWQSYEIHGPVADILKGYLAVHPVR